MSPIPTALTCLRNWPLGTHYGQSGGKHYLVSKTVFAAGRSIKLVAHERGGNDYISLCFYDLTAGPRLAPCEMPLDKVITFLSQLRRDGNRG